MRFRNQIERANKLLAFAHMEVERELVELGTCFPASGRLNLL